MLHINVPILIEETTYAFPYCVPNIEGARLRPFYVLFRYPQRYRFYYLSERFLFIVAGKCFKKMKSHLWIVGYLSWVRLMGSSSRHRHSLFYCFCGDLSCKLAIAAKGIAHHRPKECTKSMVIEVIREDEFDGFLWDFESFTDFVEDDEGEAILFPLVVKLDHKLNIVLRMVKLIDEEIWFYQILIIGSIETFNSFFFSNSLQPHARKVR